MPSAVQNGELVNWLFVDMSSYFVSGEQHEQPRLRGSPTAVVTVDVDSTCCIAASYEAKAFGISTGTQLGEAKKRCPQLHVIEARHDLYVKYHNQIKDAMESCLHISKVVSVDEMECMLLGRERQPANALVLANRVKKAIRDSVGECLRCSIGLAPNRFLAKAASNMQKPDGLVTITRSQLPQILFSLKPRDLHGVVERMEMRLRSQGIHTMEQLCQVDMEQMTKLWGGVLGTRLWLKLRGLDLDDPASVKTSIGHQHVLPPELRTREQAAAVGQKLLHKAGVRLRRAKLHTSGMVIFVLLSKPKDDKSKGSYWLHSDRPLWEANLSFPACQDTMTFINVFQQAWASCPNLKPVLVSVALVDLVPEDMQNLSLFGDMYGEWKFNRIAQVMDSVNAKYGSTALYLGGVHHVRETAPPRIAFQSIPDVSLK